MYDEEDNLTGEKYDNGDEETYGYDANGNLAVHEDKVNNKDYRYRYDASNRLVKILEKDNNTNNKNITSYEYDIESNLSGFLEQIGEKGYVTSYDYDKDGKIKNIYYFNPKNNGNLEYFPLNNSLTGSKGTKPYIENGVQYSEDTAPTIESNGGSVNNPYKDKKVLTTKSDTKIAYNLGLSKNSGTMATWIKTNAATASAPRYIITSEGKNKEFFDVYLNTDNTISVAVRRSSDSGWNEFVRSTTSIKANDWQHIAITWSVSDGYLNLTLYVNGVAVVSHSTNDFKDFTSIPVSIGGYIGGTYQLDGQMDGFVYSKDALTSQNIQDIYNSKRGNRIKYNYDSIGRIENVDKYTGKEHIITSYTYKDGVNGATTGATTTRINSIENKTVDDNNVEAIDNTIRYDYDKNGNIIKIANGDGTEIRYSYDGLNQLIREDNGAIDKTITYSYDAGGNITSRVDYPYTTTTLGSADKTYNYGYDSTWKDKLMSFDGKPITYDKIGNPLTYNNWTFTWEHGRQLAGMTHKKNPSDTTNDTEISYNYNDDGIRTEKTINGVTTTYHLVGDKVTYEDNGTDKIYYTYDSTGKLVSININSTTTPSINGEYYYIRNAQGDIIGFNDKSGKKVASYSYDSWGKLISIKDENDSDITNDATSVGYK